MSIISDRIRELAAEQKTPREIATELGVTRAHVYEVCRRLGIRYSHARRYEMPEVRAEGHHLSLPRVVTGVGTTKLNCSLSDTISELLASADLSARGWQVYRPLVGNKGVDIVAMKNGRIVTVEVRSAHRKLDGTVYFRRDVPPRADYYAIVVTGEPVQYEPDLVSFIRRG